MTKRVNLGDGDQNEIPGLFGDEDQHDGQKQPNIPEENDRDWEEDDAWPLTSFTPFSMKP